MDLSGINLTPVQGDPFVDTQPGLQTTPVEHDPWMVKEKVPGKRISEASFDDANQPLYRGADGQLYNTTPDDHVVQWDPESKKYQVYEAVTKERPHDWYRDTRLGQVVSSFGPRALYETVKSAATLPSDIYQGNMPPRDYSRAMDVAALAVGRGVRTGPLEKGNVTVLPPDRGGVPVAPRPEPVTIEGKPETLPAQIEPPRAQVGGQDVRPAAEAAPERGRGVEEGAGGLEEAQRAAAKAAEGASKLEGLPEKPVAIGDQWFVPGPVKAIQDVARQYMTDAGLEYNPPKTYAKVDEGRAARIAQAFDEMPHAPDDPKVQASYNAMIDETVAQYQALKKMGLKIDFIPPDMPDPYALSPRLAQKDLIENNHLWVFPTDSGFGSGPEAAAAMKDNPLLRPTGLVENGHPMLANDVFRIVHDIFGHFKEGNGFRASGEENAWRSHSAMYSDLARPAMTSETRGQNSWVNYGPHGEKNRSASSADTVYAPQKIGVLPDWAIDEGRHDQPEVPARTMQPMLRDEEIRRRKELGKSLPERSEALIKGISERLSGDGQPGPREKVPGIKGLVNPLPIPPGVEERLSRAVSRAPDVGAPNNAKAIKLAPGVYVGNVTLPQWKERIERHLTPEEIQEARNWYKDALPSYEKYFGPELAPAMLGAWLTANVNATPSFAQLSAIRTLEQYKNKTGAFAPQKKGGLAHEKLMQYWDAILSGDHSKLDREGSGQKIYDFIDSALLKNTRTFYGDDPRAGAPAVADVHSLRDMGFIDQATINWVEKTYGKKAAKKLQRDSEELSPGEAQYEWSANKMRAFVDKLNKEGYMGGGWTPLEMQAVGWKGMSAQLGRKGETSADAISANIKNLSYELDFGAGAPYNDQFAEWHGLTPEQKTEVSKAILPKIVEEAKNISGAHEFAQVKGLGGWHEFTNPSFKSRLIASPEVALDVADIIGYLGQQTKIFGYRWYPSGDKLGVALYGDSLKNSENVAKLWSSLIERHPEFASGFSPSINEDGMHGIEILLDKGGAKMAAKVDKELVPALQSLIEEHELGDVHAHTFKAEEASREHDWTKDPEGSSYLARLSSRYGPSIQKRLELYKQQELEPALRKAISDASPDVAAAERADLARLGELPDRDWARQAITRKQLENGGSLQERTDKLLAGMMERLFPAPSDTSIKAYHGSHEPSIELFDSMKNAAVVARRKANPESPDAVGYWFTTSSDDARVFGPHVHERYLDIVKPLVVQGWDGWQELASQKNLLQTKGSQKGRISASKMRAWMEKNGYDGIHMKGGEDNAEGLDYWVALHPSQIKFPKK